MTPLLQRIGVGASLITMALFCHSFVYAAADFTSVDDLTLERLATELQAGRDAQALAETLKAQLANKDAEIAALRAAIDQAKVADAANHEERIRADERSKLQTEQVTALKELLTDYRADLKAEREHSAALRKQAQWDRVLGAIPLIGLGLLLFTGGF